MQPRHKVAFALVAGLLALIVVAVLVLAPPPAPLPSASPSPTASPAPSPRHGQDGELDKAGLRHDSRDALYRTPVGAVPAGTPVLLRLRTFHGDASAVTARVYSVSDGGSQQLAMDLAAAGVSCYEPALATDTCDFWQTALPNAAPDNLWYRFIVTDGDAKIYYVDDTPALDGGEGVASDVALDQSFALTVYQPDFDAPEWARDAVFYQIFPDRFRNGDATNDPHTGDVRYDDPVVAQAWDALPEGYCRRHADVADCDSKDARSRDYFGGDLAGITQQLDYLAGLGVTAIYLNPIFDSGSNHGYDTQDYTRIDPYFGTQADWDELVGQAGERGIRVILDGVFNHVSSDSPFFDRYGHYDEVGGCEALESVYHDWFYFRAQPGGPCVSLGGPRTTGAIGWAGVDAIPVVHKDLPEVLDYFVLGEDSITRRWLAAGASGWRLDVSGDPTFPDNWWSTFREVVKAADPDALTVAEQWQKDTALLRQLLGDRFDTTMNYRFRDAVLGFLTPGLFDRKGFPASGAPTDPADFAARMLSQQEDYPPAAYGTLLNLLDSHDTERVRWTLTPGAETRADREGNAANVAEGLRRMGLAVLIQFTMPGAPMVYYGDEVGLTGDDDPDARRTYPWEDLGGSPDQDLLEFYRSLGSLRSTQAALVDGDLRFLLVGSDDDGTIAYGRRTDQQAAIVAINRSAETRVLAIPVQGFVPDGTALAQMHPLPIAGSQPIVVEGGVVRVELGPLSGVVLVSDGGDLDAPAAPTDVFVLLEPGADVELTWSASAGAAAYNVYASPLRGGGYVRLNDAPLTGTSYVAGVIPMGAIHFVVSAIDAAGNESGWSAEALRIPVD